MSSAGPDRAQGIVLAHPTFADKTGRAQVRPRSLLVYAAREWCGIKTKAFAEYLNRDPSMIGRLHAAYAEKRDTKSEAKLQRSLGIKSTTHA